MKNQERLEILRNLSPAALAGHEVKIWRPVVRVVHLVPVTIRGRIPATTTAPSLLPAGALLLRPPRMATAIGREGTVTFVGGAQPFELVLVRGHGASRFPWHIARRRGLGLVVVGRRVSGTPPGRCAVRAWGMPRFAGGGGGQGLGLADVRVAAVHVGTEHLYRTAAALLLLLLESARILGRWHDGGPGSV